MESIFFLCTLLFAGIGTGIGFGLYRERGVSAPVGPTEGRVTELDEERVTEDLESREIE